MRPTLATALIVSLQRLEAHLGSFDRTRTTRTMAEHVQRPEYSVAPPARLCLQDDAPAPATGDRRCVPPSEPVPLKMARSES